MKKAAHWQFVSISTFGIFLVWALLFITESPESFLLFILQGIAGVFLGVLAVYSLVQWYEKKAFWLSSALLLVAAALTLVYGYAVLFSIIVSLGTFSTS
jgi:hypothetical protein